MPSHSKVSLARSMSSGFARSGSVSSTRQTNVPPSWRAKSQLKIAVRMFPRWRSPDGAPAYLTRGGTNGVREDADARDLDLDVVAVLERRDAVRRAGHDHVAWKQRHHRRHEFDELRDTEH